MSRLTYIQILASGLLLFTLMFAPSSGADVQAQETLSAGCEELQQVFGPSTFIFSGDSLSATGDFFVTDAIRLRAELDSGAIPSNVSFRMTGPSGTFNASGQAANFSTPDAGVHTITVTNNEAATILVTASCASIVSLAPSPYIPPWEGFTDGRLSPDPAEVYSLWCEFDNLVIYYQVNGTTFLANTYPMNSLTDLSVGGTAVVTDQISGENLQIVRYDRTQYEIFGPRGNKFFIIESCFNGLVPSPPGDNDADGVLDSQDACPNWTGFAFFGCPDTDGDGLIDPVDSCPVLPGVPEFEGCPTQDNPNVDGDGDGIINWRDLCPNFVTPEGVIDRQGCPDWDGDSIVNSPRRSFAEQDHCPLDAGNVLNRGCPGTPEWRINITQVEESSIDIFEYAEQAGNFNDILVDVNTTQTTCIITEMTTNLFIICDPDFQN